MKFGKYLASRQLELPEYSGHFINYKALKKLIKQLSTLGDTSNTSTSLADSQQRLKDNKASFFFKVERELEKVNSFYLEKQANLVINLDLLLMKRDELFLNGKQLMQSKNKGSKASSVSDTSASTNFKNSITYLNLYQNFKKTHQDLLRLQQFVELNETGFQKVVKKWDKRSKSHTKELFILAAVNVQPMFHKTEINALSDLVTLSLFDLESVIDGDFTPLINFNSSRLDHHHQHLLSSLSRSQGDNESNNGHISMRSGSITTITEDELKSSGGLTIQPGEIDELFTSFVNIATNKEPDIPLLHRWMEKVKSSAKAAATNDDNTTNNHSQQDLDRAIRVRFSRIFLLSITNLKILDPFLKTFLEMVDYNIDINQIDDNFNNNKSILHECCSIPSKSTQESHVIINNGVEVVKSTDNINHSRVFIVQYISSHLKSPVLDDFLLSRDFNGRNCLHHAAQNDRNDLLFIILPYFPKNQLDNLDNESMSPLLLAIRNGNFDIIKNLVEAGSNYNPETNDTNLQYLPINYACKMGDYTTIKYLLSCHKTNDVFINKQDVEGLLALHVVSRSGHYSLIELLISHGADVNQIDSLNKWSPLFYAALEGHLHCTKELVKFGAQVSILDEDGYNVLYYCVVEGHIDVLNELLSYNTNINNNEVSSSINKGDFNDNSMSILNEDQDSEDSGSGEKQTDTIPDLQLPPPVLPLRRYGHNFLEQKVLIDLVFPDNINFIHLYNSSSDLKPGRITLSSNISDIIPRNLILPASEETRLDNCIFQTDIESLNDFRIDFEIFPKFGTRLIAKTTALSFTHIDTSSPEINYIRIPLFDLRLKTIGELRFNCQVIFPFAGSLLETSKFDTYWKSSTNVVKKPRTNNTGSLSPNSYLSPSNISTTIGGEPTLVQNINGNSVNSTNELVSSNNGLTSSYVTATSLSGRYLRIKVCLLSDGTPVVCPNWYISITDNVQLYLPNLTLDQLSSITENLYDYNKVLQDLSGMTVKDISLIKKLVTIIYLPLELVLQVIDINVNLNIEILFPSEFEIRMLPFVSNESQTLNNFIDFTLNDVFNHLRMLRNNKQSRSIIFMSSNCLICKILNWKQPNFPVFLVMNGISFSSESKSFECRSTNGLLIENGDDMGEENTSEESSGRTTSADNLIENDQENTSRSIKHAVNFAVSNNLIGIITSIHLLKLAPKLIPLIRSRGLVLVATNDVNDGEDFNHLSKELDIYTKTDINGLRFDDILSFKNDISL